MKNVPRITFQQAFDYELRSSWWASFVWWSWGQEITAWYFAQKVKRKIKRYTRSKDFQKLYLGGTA